MTTKKCTKTQLIKWLDDHLDDCPCDWYEGVNDGEIIFLLEEENDELIDNVTYDPETDAASYT